MVRNLILLVSSAAVLLVLFFAYLAMFDTAPPPQAQRARIDTLPIDAGKERATLRLAEDVSIPGGGRKMELTRYDEQTHQATARFRFEEWSPVEGSTDQVDIQQPEMTLLLPSGMVATISADRGRFHVERMDARPKEPQSGRLSGDVTIVIDTETRRARVPLEQRPQDAIRIAMEHMDFDLEAGELRTDGPVRATAAQFEIAGHGLALVWNQADNRVEEMTIRRGERLVLRAPAGWFAGLNGARNDVNPGAATRPAASRPAEPQPPPAPRRRTAYTCTITGDVVAEHLRQEQRVGALLADRLTLLFDMGGGAGRLLDRPAATASAPASAPADELNERLSVTWSGPLVLAPAPPARSGQPRRRLEAVGTTVTLALGDRAAECGRLAYYEDTQQIWLYPGPDGRVRFALGEKLVAGASSVYIDQANDLIKLIGDVSLETRGAAAATGGASSIHCSSWAELRLRRSAQSQPASTQPALQAQLESARFVGDVRIRLRDQLLTAHELYATFRPSAGGEKLEALLESAVALGGVRLEAERRRLECGWLRLAFAQTDEGETYPCELEAIGSVELRDAAQKRFARGKRLVATLTADQENPIQTATIFGVASRHAAAVAEGFAVRGLKIEFNVPAQTLHIDGRAALAFRSRRSLQGRERDRPQRVTIRCADSLHVDGLGNTVHFVGQVVARTGDERLLAESLTLLLEDVPAPTKPPGLFATLGAFAKQTRTEYALAFQPPASSAPAVARRAAPSLRKEPLRLIARGASVISESFAPGDDQPLVRSSISAPEIEVEIKQRRIRTAGRTTLGMIDRRLIAEPESLRPADGLGSALLTRGPSQTVLQCEKSMIYVIGPEGPARRDSILFEGNVMLVHAAGREMENLERMLPQLRDNPELLAQLEHRFTKMDADRMEGELVAVDVPSSAGRPPLRLAWINTYGNVYMLDRRGALEREIHAHQVEFDRGRRLIRVSGSPNAEARMYVLNTETGQFDEPFTGAEITVDLATNEVRTKKLTGRIRRP